LTDALSSEARSKIAAILLEQPRVTRVLILDEEGPTGERYTVVYVVPSAELIEATRSQIYSDSQGRRMNQWRTIFNQTYRLRKGDNAPNFVGWNSSYTNMAIPEPEMEEWLDRTIERVTALRPRRVLEIGCGVGLLVERLSPRCRAYRATDFSPVAIKRLREFVSGRTDLHHVELAEREATDFDGLASGSIDLVILNSVVQYFPDLKYLWTVLQRAAGVLISGNIFVGDVRHFGLLPTFHASIQFAKAAPEANVRWLRRRISLAVAQERELVIDPQFFLELSQSIPGIVGAEILPKRGRANNELTRYRYDVVLHVGDTEPAQNGYVAEWEAGGEAIADLVSRFKEQELPAVRILDVPNARVAHDLALLQILESGDEQQTIKDIRHRMSGFENTAVDPEILWQLLDPQFYDVCVGYSPGSPNGHFDVALIDRRQWFDRPPLRRRHADWSGRTSPALATHPVAAALMQQFALDLGEMLRPRLPEPLLPAAIVVVNELPA
jgi:SAM-dependent methyltransferase